MTNEARVREIALIIDRQDMGPGVSLGARLAAGMFDYYPKDSQGRKDARKCAAWAVNQVARAIAALPPQPVITEEERTALKTAREFITDNCNLDYSGGRGRTESGKVVDAISGLLDRLSAQPGNHQSSTSARDAALEEVAKWHDEQEANNRAAMASANRNNSAGRIIEMYRHIAQTHANSAERIRAMKSADEKPEWVKKAEGAALLANTVTGSPPTSGESS